MALYDYSPLISTALSLLTRFGQPITYQVVANPSPEDSDKPWRIGPTDDGDVTEFATVGVIIDFPVTKAVASGDFEPGDKQCFIPGILATVPTIRNYITGADGQIWSIENVETIAPSGENILHICTVRKWPQRLK
jgi:hypothetical protein